MAATKLRVYNDALRLLGDAPLALITDDVDSRYALDGAWDEAVAFVLRQAFWRFALKTATLVIDGSSIPAFAVGYGYPADWIRTHAIFFPSGTRECPLDLREQGTHVLINGSVAPTMRYVSNTFADPALASNPWPEQFAQCVAAYLAFLVAERVTGDRGAPATMSRLFASLLPEAVAIDALDEDPWLPHQRDGSFRRISGEMMDKAFWRFTLKTAVISVRAGPGEAFANLYAVPADWTQTRSLFVLTTATAPTGAGERRPLKIREHAGFWHTDAASFYAEYVSSTLALDSTRWPHRYMNAVLRALHFDRAARADDKDLKDDAAIWKDSLGDVRDGEADAEDPWLEYQLDGSFDVGSRAVLGRGYWWWGLKTLDIDTSSQETLSPQAGFPYRYELPSDWLRTHALFVAWDGHECPINIRETNQDWSTDASVWTARYVSTDVLDPATWPEQVAEAVRAYLDWKAEGDHGAGDPKIPGPARAKEAAFDRLLADALTAYSRPEDDWLRFQLDGRYASTVKMVLERGRWRFAVKTVSLEDSADPNAFSDGSTSPGYSVRLPKPLDWLRTLRLYRSLSDGLYADWSDIDYRDELGAFHCNWSPAILRYVSRLGLDSTQWPMNFRDAVMAWLQYSEIAADPKMTAAAGRKLEFFQLQCREAETLDDERDVPRVINTGRFVAARYGRSRMAREEGWGRW